MTATWFGKRDVRGGGRIDDSDGSTGEEERSGGVTKVECKAEEWSVVVVDGGGDLGSQQSNGRGSTGISLS